MNSGQKNEYTREEIEEKIQDLIDQVKAIQAEKTVFHNTYRDKLAELTYWRRKKIRLGREKDGESERL